MILGIGCGNVNKRDNEIKLEVQSSEEIFNLKN